MKESVILLIVTLIFIFGLIISIIKDKFFVINDEDDNYINYDKNKRRK
jgi:hypothetical protein